MGLTLDQGILFSLIILIFGFLLWGRFRYDLVAFAALVVAYLLGVIPKNEVFAGFGHPAVVIIALVLIISRGLNGSGAIELLAKKLIDSTRSIGAHIGIMSGVAAVLSAIMNNVAALALLMPMDIQTAAKAKRSPALTLMPLSFASILGGMITLIGTPPNVVIATFREDALGEPYGMFDFAPVGLIVAVVGVLFVALVGWRLIPVKTGKGSLSTQLEGLEGYLSELCVPEGSKFVGEKVKDLDLVANELEVQVLGLIRDGHRLPGRSRSEIVITNDILVVEGGAETIDQFLGEGSLTYNHSKKHEEVAAEGTALIEVAVPQNSRIAGRSAMGWIYLPLALAAVVIVFISIKIVPLSQVYRSVEWSVIVLLAAMIPIGAALESSGGTDIIANQIVNWTSGMPTVFVLAVLMIVTMSLSDVLNNVATALIAAPIGVEIANRLEANPDSFLMAVAVAASCAFLTPIGHKNNTIIMGPGGYKFGDYWRMGLPLEIIVVLVGLPAILFFWPL